MYANQWYIVTTNEKRGKREQKARRKLSHIVHSCRAVVFVLKVWLGGGGNWKGRNAG